MRDWSHAVLSLVDGAHGFFVGRRFVLSLVVFVGGYWAFQRWEEGIASEVAGGIGDVVAVVHVELDGCERFVAVHDGRLDEDHELVAIDTFGFGGEQASESGDVTEDGDAGDGFGIIAGNQSTEDDGLIVWNGDCC